MATRLDVYGSQPWYREHLLPVYEALPAERRGDFLETTTLRPGRPVLIASYADVGRARRARRRYVYMEHGAGQSYAGDRSWRDHPAYAGGKGREGASMILAPNVQSATRWRDAYPAIPVHVIGATRLLPPPTSRDPLLAVSFHWSGTIPESKSALAHYRSALPEIARQLPVIGHGHPRIAGTLESVFRKAGIEYVPSLQDVARRATVYAVDNSSTLWELGLSRPVIALDAPWYRRDVSHGLRFWSDVPGISVQSPEALVHEARKLLQREPDEWLARRLSVTHRVLPYLDGAERAARLLSDWLMTQDRGRSDGERRDVTKRTPESIRVGDAPLRAF